MTFSTEELFLKVLAQTAKRSKLRRSIQDDCKYLLKTRVQRMLLDDLLREQSMNLSSQYPFLELKLADLSCSKRRTGLLTYETRSINVILKTEWAPKPLRHGPMAPEGGAGATPYPPGFGGLPYKAAGPPFGDDGNTFDIAAPVVPVKVQELLPKMAATLPVRPMRLQRHIRNQRCMVLHTCRSYNPRLKSSHATHACTLSGRNQRLKLRHQTARTAVVYSSETNKVA